ncbi:MAG: ABC transporter permease, partial [Opitutae bacterium]|nr:ABC transporter permease [Opitutae bacterium]
TESPHGVHSRLGSALVILQGACGLLLLIVCANLSNLLFLRATARRREMCLRQALGAGWPRLLRPLLAASFLLATAGALLALLLSLWLMNVLQSLLPATTMPVTLTGQLDWRVFGFVVALATLVTAVAGLTPSLWALRCDLTEALRGGRGAGTGAASEYRRGLLVAAQVAVALVAIACAGLAVKSFYAARRADPGFDPRGVLLAALKLDASGNSQTTGLAFLDRLQERLTPLPGVEAVSFSEDVPLGLEGGSWADVTVPGHVPAPDENMKIGRNLVAPGYFELMRIPLLAGREFRPADDAAAPPAAIVNETFARRYFGTVDAAGRTFFLSREQRILHVVGVVADVKYHSLSESARPFFYLALRQFYRPSTGLAVHIRTADGDPLAQLPALRRAVHDTDPAVPVFAAMPLADYIGAASFAPKAIARLLGPLSVFALGLAGLGLYGVLGFAVAQRMPEIGVRLALGGRPADIERLVLRRGTALAGLGIAVGLFAAVAVTRVLASALYGISPFEPVLLLLAAITVAAIALPACWLPAARAARTDPMSALRAE